jgi:hypothetical protein
MPEIGLTNPSGVVGETASFEGTVESLIYADSTTASAAGDVLAYVTATATSTAISSIANGTVIRATSATTNQRVLAGICLDAGRTAGQTVRVLKQGLAANLLVADYASTATADLLTVTSSTATTSASAGRAGKLTVSSATQGQSFGVIINPATATAVGSVIVLAAVRFT